MASLVASKAASKHGATGTVTASKLAPVVSCHAFNWDRSMCAVCPNSSGVKVYSNCANEDLRQWELAYDLPAEHTMVVSGIDWSPVTNKIVTCSHDRNAFVWTYDNDSRSWQQSLVILRINRAALDVKWSPDGTKFAVASGAKCIPVCHYEADNDWWISKMIKKHRSTVLSVDWHPNSQLIVTGGCDFKCRVFSGFISAAGDQPSEDTLFGDLSDSFGELLAEFDASHGWINSVAWSPSGMKLAFAGHDSSLSFVHFQGDDEQPTVQTIRTRDLPFSKIMFCDEGQLVGVGHEMNPTEFLLDNSGLWDLSRKLDQLKSGEKKAQSSSTNKGFAAARSMFGGRGKAAAGKAGGRTQTKCDTKHTACITDISSVSSPGEPVTRFATSGLDGQIFFWNI